MANFMIISFIAWSALGIAYLTDVRWSKVIKTRDKFHPAAISLFGVARWFFGQPRIWCLVAVICSTIGMRAVSGPAELRDLFALVPVIGWTFIEWGHHVFVLHGGASKRLHVSHETHHRCPYEPQYGIGSVWSCILFWIAAFTAFWFGRIGLLSGLLAGQAMLLVYEFVHFTIHTAYRPMTKAGRLRKQLHWIHHAQDATKNYGVVGTTADKALGTSRVP